MSGNVNNGRRVAVEFGEFEGVAGFVAYLDGSAQMAFIPNVRGTAAAVGAIISIEGKDWRVTSRENSPYVDRMVVITLTSTAK